MKKILFIIYILLILAFVRLNGSDAVTAGETFVKKALDRISPSVVKVVTQNHRRFIATGVAIGKDTVLSNITVLNHPFDRIYIETVKGNTFDVKVAAKDKSSSLILLRTKEKVLQPVKKGEIPQTGEWVGLVGVFYKRFPSLNQGIISSRSGTDLILNATVAPGSTGGAVVNRNGEFVGLIRGVFGYKLYPQYTFKDNQSELKIVSSVRGGKDLCYAIPSNRVFRIAEDLEKYGKVKRGWLGVNISTDEKGFVRVDSIVKASPAHTGGIREGDRIIEISGNKIKTPVQLSESIKMLRPGDNIVVSVSREGKNRKINVKLADLDIRSKKRIQLKELELEKKLSQMPEYHESLPKIRNYTFNVSKSRSLGADMIPLTPELAAEFKVKSGNGLLVSRVWYKPKKDAPVLKVGDILTTAEGESLNSVSDLSAVLQKLKQDKKVKITLIRKGKKLEKMVAPVYLGFKPNLIERFNKKFFDARFWMEMQQQMKMKEELEKLKVLKEREMLQQEKSLRKKDQKKIQDELEKKRLESLEKYKLELEQLIKEKQAVEKELKKLKKKKKEKEDDPGLPTA